ncbi:inactive dipeptidyl peptidase 10 [Sarotherodon galilaeus]
MVKEVVRSFQSADSKSAGEERISQRIVPPKRLEEMVNSAVQIIRGFCSKLDCMPSCIRRTTSPDEEPHSSTQVEHLDIKVDLENVLEKVDSLKTETSEIVHAAIHEAVNELNEIIDEELIKLAEYSPLLSDIAEENESFTSSLVNSVVEDISEGPCGSWSLAQIKEKIQQSLKKAADKIKSFFAKRFAKVMILRTAIQLWSRCHSTPAAKSSESVQKLVGHVNSLIINKETLEKEKNEFKRLQDRLSQGKLLVFTELLTDILHQYTSEGMGPEIVPEQVVMAERQKILHNDLQAKARRFLGLFRWWLNTQAESHSQRVILALLDTQELMLSLPSVTTETIKPIPVAVFCRKARKAEKKAKLKLILHKLISTTFKEANLLCTYQDPNHILTWLLDYVWAELEDEELYITSKTFKTIDKKLLKDLCNTMGFIEHVIVSMELQESETAKCIVASLKDRLGKPKAKRSAIVRFFCALGRAIAKPFRRNT